MLVVTQYKRKIDTATERKEDCCRNALEFEKGMKSSAQIEDLALGM